MPPALQSPPSGHPLAQPHTPCRCSSCPESGQAPDDSGCGRANEKTKNLEEPPLHPSEIRTSSERAQLHRNPQPAGGKDACRSDPAPAGVKEPGLVRGPACRAGVRPAERPGRPARQSPGKHAPPEIGTWTREGSPFCHGLAVSLQNSRLTKPDIKLTGKREMFTESKFHVTKQDKEWL